MIEEKYNEQFILVAETFKRAESKIKEIEIHNSEIIIPSLNELRYVGYHIILAGKAQDEQKIDEELQKANQHAERAIYDAIEAGLLYKIEEIRNFHMDFDHIPQTTKIIDGYLDKMSKVQNALQTISLVDKETREDKYKEIEVHYKTITEIANIFQLSSNKIKDAVYEDNKKAKQEGRRFIINALLATLAIVVAVAIAYFTSNKS